MRSRKLKIEYYIIKLNMGNVFEIKNHFAKYEHVNSTLLYGDFTKCKNPTVSVLMPAYNRPDYLEKALMSAVNQNCKNEYEIVITDNSDEENSKLNLKVVNKIGGGQHILL
jgi:cellulose synthase/poly-beta-1,6-N-acetylglucosamine synthase-like glycosyltransferase